MIEDWQTPHMELAADTKQFTKYSPTSTPILDVLRPLPARKRMRFNTGEYLFLSGAVMLTLIELPAIRNCAEYMASLVGVTAACVVVCLLIPVAAFLAALGVHEAGHLLAAWMAGFRVLFFDRGCHAGRKLYSCDVLQLGLLSLEPRKLDRLPRRFCVLAVGGPLASFLAPGLVEGYLQFTTPGVLAAFAAHIFAALSLLLGAAALLPDTGKGSFSDGARILMLLKNDASTERWLSIVRLQLALDRGEHPRGWEESLIAAAVAAEDDSRDSVAGRWLAYLWAAERHDITAATKYLEDALAASSRASAALRDRLFLEAAVFQAWFREDPANAEYWRRRVRKGRLASVHQRRLDAASLWVEGRLFDAFEKLGDCIAMVSVLPASPTRDLVEKSVLEWKEYMESRMLTRAWRAMHSLSQQVDLSEMPSTSPAGSSEIASW